MSQPQPRFTQTRDQAGQVLTVIDATTGLEWTAKPIGDGKQFTQREAEDACGALELAGHTDWLLPTRQELLSLVDLSRYSPAIDTEAFPAFPSDWFWTRDLCAWSSASAWGVYFGYGDVGSGLRGDLGFALAVRRAGQ